MATWSSSNGRAQREEPAGGATTRHAITANAQWVAGNGRSASIWGRVFKPAQIHVTKLGGETVVVDAVDRDCVGEIIRHVRRQCRISARYTVSLLCGVQLLRETDPVASLASFDLNLMVSKGARSTLQYWEPDWNDNLLEAIIGVKELLCNGAAGFDVDPYIDELVILYDAQAEQFSRAQRLDLLLAALRLGSDCGEFLGADLVVQHMLSHPFFRRCPM